MTVPVPTGPPALELRSIVKEYEQNRVLKGVSLSVREGEIHALVGENGAGKSTLMNILFGMPVIWETGGYEGEVLLGGAPARFHSPAEAMEAGIGMVHQEFMLLPASRVLGRSLESLDIRRMRADARRALDQVGLTIDEWIPVAGLPVGHMQFIEIAREVDKANLKLLIFDEATAVLTETDAEKLLEIMRGLAAKGHAILFITHRLDEVLAVADRITVLRDGEIVGTPDPKSTTVVRIAELMVGRPAAVVAQRRFFAPTTEPVLGIERVIFDKALFPLNEPRLALERGLAFVSEDRRGVGLLPEESIELNIALSALEAQGRFLHPSPIPALQLLNHRAMRAHALEMIQALDIRTTGPSQQVRRLSGGNQQKVCVARAMTLTPRLLFVSEPTRGIDVGAKQRVLEILAALNRDHGVTLVVTSSELAELRAISDRVAIVYRGKIAAILPPDAPDAQFGLAMAGETAKAA